MRARTDRNEINLNLKILAHKDVGIEIFQTENKGRGIRATREFEKGDFIAEYSGDLITKKERREEEYSQDSSVGSYIVTLPAGYGFIDATE